MSEIDQQFIEYVVKSLVGKPDAVHIERRIDEKGVLLELTVDPEDLGRVIGKRGATAQSLRTLLRALGTKNDARYNLKIIDNGVGPDKSSDESAAPKNDTSAPAKADKPEPKAEPESKPEKPEEAETPVDEPQAEPETEEADPEAEPEPEAEEEADKPEDQTSDRLRQAREELADLDDLDV